MKEKGYYFNTTYNKYVKCDKACLACYSGLIRNNTNCIKCNEDMGYYSIKGKNEAICLNEEIIGEGYFLNKNKIPFVWEEVSKIVHLVNLKEILKNELYFMQNKFS